MQAKLETNKKIVTCLNGYCQHGCDKDIYLSQIKNWEDRFQRDAVKSVQIPKQLQDIIPFAETLNPLINVHCWRVYLNSETATSVQRSEEAENEWRMGDNSFLRSSLLYLNDKEVDIPCATTEAKNKNCLDILEEVIRCFKQFVDGIRRICTSLQHIPVKHILQLFSSIQHAENDLELLKPFLDPKAQQQLVCILSFCKSSVQIRHVCIGLEQLHSKLSIAYDSTLFAAILTVTESTTGEECTSIYEEYRKQIKEHFSDNILTFISYYSSSSDLFEFLHSLTADDIYNLQEAVNDWDETLVNTKTVFDFAIVKTFIDRSYEAICVKQQQLKDQPFQLKLLNNCFAEVWKNDQFKDLLKCLESSSLSVTSIKRIHLELTDKEQSKRRQIVDILQKSTICFVRILHYDATFDVNVELPPGQTTTTDTKKRAKLLLADISELRDRARLLEYSSNVNNRKKSQADSEHEKERLQNFVEFAALIESTIEYLTNLYTSGHPSVGNFLQGTKSFLCIDGKYDELQQDNTKLTILLKDWETNLCNMYETHISLTYFSDDQFWQIEDYIYRRSSLADPGYHLLKYIG
ncbi:unnamed protein product, partial [Adineta ricciae]